MITGRLKILINLFILMAIPFAQGSPERPEQADTRRKTSIHPEEILSLLKISTPKEMPYLERRYLPTLQPPLISQGTVAFIPPDLLIKRVEKPTTAEFRIQNRQILMTEAGNLDSYTLPLEEVPEIALLAETLIALLSGDLVGIEKRFDLVVTGNVSSWTLTLHPKTQENISLTRIEVKGLGERLSALTIFQGDSDPLYLEFSPP